MKVYFRLVLPLLILGACKPNAHSSDQNLPNWWGHYQGLEKSPQAQIFWNLDIDSSGLYHLERSQLDRLDDLEKWKDSIRFSAEGSQILLGNNEAKFELSAEGLKSKDGTITLRRRNDYRSIEDQKWILKSLNDKALDFEGKAPYLLFNSQIRKLSAYDACNYINAPYRINYTQREIYLSPLAATRRYCPDSDSLAQHFQKLLDRFDHFEIKNEALVLLDEELILAEFSKEKP